MVKELQRRAAAGLMAFAIVLANVMLPIVPAYADKPGTYQPVWCKVTGNGWKAQLSANSNGKDGALIMTQDIIDENLDVVKSGIEIGSQVYAHDRSDKLDAFCQAQLAQTAAVEIETVEPTCDIAGRATFVGQGIKLTSNGGELDQTVGIHTATFTALAGYTFANGETTLNLEYTILPKLSGEQCEEPQVPPVIAPCRVMNPIITVTKESEFADYTESRSQGFYAFSEDGLLVGTKDNSSLAKVAWYHSEDYPLADIGTPLMDYTSSFGIAPGLQVVVDFKGDGTETGILVGESVYGGSWWLTNSSSANVKADAPHTGGGHGSEWFGTLSEWLANFPDAQVVAVGFSLGSGVYAEGTLHSLTFGCQQWNFTAPENPGQGGDTPETPESPKTPEVSKATEEPVVLPYTAGASTPTIVLAALSLAGLALLAGIAIKSRLIA